MGLIPGWGTKIRHAEKQGLGKNNTSNNPIRLGLPSPHVQTEDRIWCIPVFTRPITGRNRTCSLQSGSQVHTVLYSLQFFMLLPRATWKGGNGPLEAEFESCSTSDQPRDTEQGTLPLQASVCSLASGKTDGNSNLQQCYEEYPCSMCKRVL